MINADIDQLTGVIEQLLAPYEEQLQQAESMPGWGRRAAQDALAETGALTPPGSPPGRTWPPGPGAPPWTTSPASAPDAQNPRRATGTWPASPARPPSRPRTQTRKGARYPRSARRRGKPKAQVAVGNTQLKVYHKLLSNPGMRYQDLGADYYDRQANVRRQIAHHVGKLGALGFEVTLARIPDPEPGGPGDSQAA